jgi:HAD superfamily phosphoserine phosphatase-like hydrolase
MNTQDLIQHVLALSPQTVAFDCDGTLWAGDSGEDFLKWELARGDFPPEESARLLQDYAAYQSGAISEVDFWGSMVTIHAGMRDASVHQMAQTFFPLGVQPRIFESMRELVTALRMSGVEIWLVSASNQWLIEAGANHLSIPRDHVLAAAAELRDGIVTTKLSRVPSGAGKPKALQAAGVDQVDIAFGNSIFDKELLSYADHAIAINPSPELAQIAANNDWVAFFT